MCALGATPILLILMTLRIIMTQLIGGALNVASFSGLVNPKRITGHCPTAMITVLVATGISLVQAIYTPLVFLPLLTSDKRDRKYQRASKD